MCILLILDKNAKSLGFSLSSIEYMYQNIGGKTIDNYMKFKQWVENEINTPASAEVIRSGLQPQVDAEEIHTSQKDDLDKIMAIDSHLQRVKESIRGMSTKSPKLRELKDFVVKMLAEWETFKNRNDGNPSQQYLPVSQDKIDYMKKNQPLPEMPNQMAPNQMGTN